MLYQVRELLATLRWVDTWVLDYVVQNHNSMTTIRWVPQRAIRRPRTSSSPNDDITRTTWSICIASMGWYRRHFEEARTHRYDEYRLLKTNVPNALDHSPSNDSTRYRLEYGERHRKPEWRPSTHLWRRQHGSEKSTTLTGATLSMDPVEPVRHSYTQSSSKLCNPWRNNAFVLHGPESHRYSSRTTPLSTTDLNCPLGFIEPQFSTSKDNLKKQRTQRTQLPSFGRKQPCHPALLLIPWTF